MSNQSVSNEGKDRTDENVALVAQESRVESHLPPPLDPSSSSTLPPLNLHDPSQPSVASSSASGDPVEAQIAQLFSLVGQLSSENEALQAQVALQSSAFVRLSSAISRLSSENEDRDRLISQISDKVLPDGFWVWEKEADGGRNGKEGRWSWSSDRHRLTPTVVVHSPPSSNMESLPDEILEEIVRLLPRSDQTSLCRVLFRFLRIASKSIYHQVILSADRVALLVRSRLESPPPEQSRISTFLSLQHLIIYHDPMYDPSFDSLLDLDGTLAEDRSSVVVQSLSFTPSSDLNEDLILWSPLLRLLNPVFLHLKGNPFEHPFVARIPSSTMLLLSSWNRLTSVCITTGGPVPLSDDGSSAFLEVFRRAVEPEIPIVVSSYGRTDDRLDMSNEEIEDMMSFLEELGSQEDLEDGVVSAVEVKVVKCSDGVAL
ncbi:hypothetical protein BDY24DRAFT_97870 [Mrakia frigida]|uniref:uncharacterized protein n=1 Tax=Mrakia frigida TaxID=29902 RepID=UPI003FCC17D5